MGRHHRKTEIHRRRKRREKLAKLRKRFAAAKTDAERAKILEKVKRITLSIHPERYLQAGGETERANA
ncbi:MAG: hypothetical protein KatS3mg076_3236 [Candidatus Binatia bacterium]|nr:MAG: hypothetical protein KatS3mg076_3236 [Candidatus Binatia bacterium]